MCGQIRRTRQTSQNRIKRKATQEIKFAKTARKWPCTTRHLTGRHPSDVLQSCCWSTFQGTHGLEHVRPRNGQQQQRQMSPLRMQAVTSMVGIHDKPGHRPLRRGSLTGVGSICERAQQRRSWRKVVLADKWAASNRTKSHANTNARPLLSIK